MKKLTLLLAALASVAIAVAQVQMPAPSPTQTITQDFGIGKIVLTYSRPAIKGRTLFAENSDLAPLGKLWRTGANAATRISFSDYVTIGGKKLDTGTYVIYTIPNKTECTIIINKGINNAGTDGYKESEDVVRFNVPVKKMEGVTVENFTMQFANIQPERCELNLAWGNNAITIPITTEIKERIKAQIEAALKTDKKPYWQAANFYFDWDKNNAKALEYVTKAVEENANAFWMFLFKAKVEKAMGNKAAAKESAKKCIEVATAAKNDDYVKQANDLIKGL